MQLGHSWFSIARRPLQLVECIGVGEGSYLHIDLLLFSTRLVELINQTVEWRFRLPAIDMPDRDGGRRLFFFCCSGTARTRK